MRRVNLGNYTTLHFLLLVSCPPGTRALDVPCGASVMELSNSKQKIKNQNPKNKPKTKTQKNPQKPNKQKTKPKQTNQKTQTKTKSPFHLIKVKMWESKFLPLPLGRATPDRASRTELLPELWSPITAIAGKDRSFSIPRALRLSTRSMQGRIFSSYWLYKECSAAW